MNLYLDNLLPTYFDESRKQNSEIWGKELRFENGALVKIVAPSGSGKTSLIQFLYGIRKTFTGTIKYADQNLAALRPEEVARLRQATVSVVFQDMRLFPDQTVAQNLEIKRGLTNHYQSDKVAEMCARLGIGDKMNSLASNCSYGEQQRVSIVRSVLQPFDFLLLDEPFSHLDNANAKKAMDLLLEEASARNACVILADLELVSHFPYTEIYHL